MTGCYLHYVDHGLGLGVAPPPRFTAGRAEPTLAARVRKLIPLAVLMAGLVAYFLIYRYQVGRAGQQSPVRSDGQGYYAYLPSYLLYHDVSFRSLIQGHLSPLRTGFRPSTFGFSLQPNGYWLDKYPVGEAILLLPFFLTGHLIATVMGVAADGYSHPELYAAGVAGLVYTVLGLSALGAALRRWFSEWVTAATLVVVAFGTGVFDYATYDSIFSHAFSSFAVSVMLLAAVRWYENPDSLLRALVLGLAAGAVIALRLTDVVLLPAVLLLGVGSLAAARERLLLLRGNIARVGVAAAATLADVVPLLAIPLAYVFASLSRPRTRVLVGGACLVLVAVACVQMVNHWLGPLPGSGIGPSGFFGILVFRS